MKTPVIGLLITFFMPLTSWGFQSFSWPEFCPQGSVHLEVISKSKFEQNIWIETWSDESQEWESSMQTLLPRESKTLTSDNIPQLRKAFSLIAQIDRSVRAFIRCQNSNLVALQEVEAPEVKYQWFIPIKKLDLTVLGLSWSPQVLHILALDESGQTLQKTQIKIEKYYDTKSIHLEFPEGVQQLWIKSDSRFASVTLADGRWNSSVSPLDYQMSPDASKTYFLASPRDGHGDSFVVSLTDSEKIQQARWLAAHPESEKIIVGQIELGNKNENRSFTRLDKAPYSWSIKTVSSFSDFAHIDCDGSPEIVENTLPMWLANGGRICFWRYRIKKELTLEEVTWGELKK